MRTILKKSIIHRIAAMAIAAAMFLTPCVAFAEETEENPSTAEKVYGWFESVPIDIFDGNVSPGTQGQHTFSIRNTSNYALDYQLVFYGADGAIPLKYRIRNEDQYLIGNDEIWEEATVAESAKSSAGTVPYGGKLDLVIEWWWPFESGDDEKDTAVGINVPDEMFYVAIIGTGRDASSAPIIVKTDFVEPAGPYSFPIITIIFGTAIKVGLIYHRKKGGNTQ